MFKPGSKSWFNLTKPVLLVVCLLPIISLVLGAFEVADFRLGANPVEEILDVLGIWAIRFLLITLAVSPLRKWTGWNWLLRYRRMLGLFAFAYVALHFTTYLLLDLGLQWSQLIEDIIKRPFITIGFIALCLLIPLAITSTGGWMRRLGRRWQKLHYLVYPASILAVWHFYWQVKLDAVEPAIYAGILLFLLAIRLVWKFKKVRRSRTAKPKSVSAASSYSN